MSSAAVTNQKLEALIDGATTARVTRSVIEVLIPTVSRSPTTPTGAGVTLSRVEALIGGSPSARVTTYVIEVLVLDTSTRGEPGAGTINTVAFGYAV